MKFDNTNVFNFEGSFFGMRNPLESWTRSDSDFHAGYNHRGTVLGKNDLDLAQRLIKAGGENRKFMRQIFISVDITAPLYWFKEFDTYKVGTVANSTSTMHKIQSKPITYDCFELTDKMKKNKTFELYVNWLEELRKAFVETKDKDVWKALIQALPESWLQTRTITMNYENVYSMIRQRQNHKLTEWSVDFIDWCKSLPYANELLFIGLEDNE